MIDLGSMGRVNSVATAINNLGQAVGHVADAQPNTYSDVNYRAFVWQVRTGMVSLGTLGGQESWANGINDLGEVVGGAQDVTGQSRAFLWQAATGMVDLNTLIDPAAGWFIGGAGRINDRGWITASALDASGKWQAVVLAPVPEPGGLASLGIGLVALLWRRPRR